MSKLTKKHSNVTPINHWNGMTDKRFTITYEWTGSPMPEYVFRFCDEFIYSSYSYEDVVKNATIYQAERYKQMEA